MEQSGLFIKKIKASATSVKLCGGMEVAILVGYPGTIASVWQQAGRAGRGDDASLVILVPYDAPIDQYMVQHPDYFFGRSRVTVNRPREFGVRWIQRFGG